MASLSHKLTPLEKKNGPLPKLLPADIVLVRIKGSSLRGLIRFVTKSYWDHVAMIVYPKGENKLEHSIIVENIAPPHSLLYFLLDSAEKGAEMHKLDKYLNNPKKYDIGIKRLDWLSAKHREQIAAFSLTNLDTPYWRLPFFRFLLAAIWPNYRRWFLRHQRWSCSAAVQHAYYESIVEWRDRFKVVFKQGDLSPIEMQDLISPAEIASSFKTDWVYNEH